MSEPGLESPYAWRLAVVSMLAIAVGVGGLYLPVVAMAPMAAEFGNQRQIPSLAYTLAYIGTGFGGIAMGWLADRLGPRWPVMLAGLMIALGCALASRSGALGLLASYTLLVGLLGHSGTFAPLANNITGWFERRRGTALAIVAVGNALGGFAWPQVYRFLLPAWGWRQTLLAYGLFAGALLLAAGLYVRPPPGGRLGRHAPREDFHRLPFRSPFVMGLLGAAGLGCCTPMAMPLVHMVAFCGDLGLPAARGSEAVSLILLVAVASAFLGGRVIDRIGPLPTVLIGSSIQAFAVIGFMTWVDDLASLWLFSAIMGVPFIVTVQGYALILRDFYGPHLAGWRLGYIMLFTLCGMALGSWLAGVIFDLTLRYQGAFLAGLAFNVLNLAAVGLLYWRWQRVK